MNLPHNAKMSTKQARKKLLPWWSLYIIVAIAIILLVLFTPKEQEISHDIEIKPPSEITLRYIENLLKKDPNNKVYQLQLIQQLIGLKRFDQAKILLEIFPKQTSNDRFYWDVEWLKFQYQYQYLAYQMLQATKNKQSEIKIFTSQKQQELVSQIKKLTIGIKNPIRLNLLAQQATFIEQPELATHIYKKLEKIQPTKNAKVLGFYGKIAIYGGDYKSSAEFYLEAKRHVTDLKDKRKYFKDAIIALQQVEEPKMALQTAISNLGKLENDKETLIFIIKFALATGEPQIASKYLSKILYESGHPKTQ